MPSSDLLNTAFNMIDIQTKTATHRCSIAKGTIKVGPTAFALINERKMPKGDPLILAEIAGINGAKSVAQAIPLCHHLNLDQILVYVVLDKTQFAINVYSVVKAYAQTGVEMEALAAVNSALLCIYDLTKIVEPALLLCDIRLIFKQGGKHGTWIHPAGIPKEIAPIIESFIQNKKFYHTKVAILKISDRGAAGTYKDLEESKQSIIQKITDLGMDIVDFQIIPNEPKIICNSILSLIEERSPHLIITSGGTGLAARDTTPETVSKICDRLIPGLNELLRLEGSKYNKYSWLSRAIAGMIKNTIILTLPGKPKSVLESMEILQNILPHALQNILGENYDHVS